MTRAERERYIDRGWRWVYGLFALSCGLMLVSITIRVVAS
jgi:hypothetical protein